MLDAINSSEQFDAQVDTTKESLLGNSPQDPANASSWTDKHPKTTACLVLTGGSLSLLGFIAMMIYFFNKKEYYSKVSIKNNSALVVQDPSPGWEKTITPPTHDGLLFYGYKASFSNYDPSDAMMYWNVINYITQENCTIALGTNSDTSLNSYTTCDGAYVRTDKCHDDGSYIHYCKEDPSSQYILSSSTEEPNTQQRYLRGSWGFFSDSKQPAKAPVFLTHKL